VFLGKVLTELQEQVPATLEVVVVLVVVLVVREAVTELEIRELNNGASAAVEGPQQVVPQAGLTEQMQQITEVP
jgi:hypothetical protein